MRALVTGADGGIGRAIVARARAEGYDVEELDLVTGFDVSDAASWEDVGAVELAFLNAGVLTGEAELARVTEEQYRRILGVNVDGVVFGVRRLARVCDPGSVIVVTASLAGLTDMPIDPLYALTKHALVGLVRSAAPQLAAREIRINAVCPGIADTTMVSGRLREAVEAADFPLLRPAEVAEAAWRAATSDETGQAWVVQPGREPEPFRFPGVPGPRAGAAGRRPPL